jgi:hypothetical protein
MEGIQKGVNWRMFAKQFLSWVSTLFVVGLATAAIFAQVRAARQKCAGKQQNPTAAVLASPDSIVVWFPAVMPAVLSIHAHACPVMPHLDSSEQRLRKCMATDAVMCSFLRMLLLCRPCSPPARLMEARYWSTRMVWLLPTSRC